MAENWELIACPCPVHRASIVRQVQLGQTAFASVIFRKASTLTTKDGARWIESEGCKKAFLRGRFCCWQALSFSGAQ